MDIYIMYAGSLPGKANSSDFCINSMRPIFNYNRYLRKINISFLWSLLCVFTSYFYGVLFIRP